MHLNKLLFPAPHSSHEAKFSQNEIIWVTHNKSRKDFKFDRKEVQKAEEPKKPHLSSGAKFINLFKHLKPPKNAKQPKIITTLNLETHSNQNYTADSPQVQAPTEKVESSAETPKNLLNTIDKSAQRKKEAASSSPHHFTPNKMSIDDEEELKKCDDRYKKKKKNKAACLGFLPKTHKDKKITLEPFDGFHSRAGSMELPVSPDAKGSDPELPEAIMQDNNEHQFGMEKESSSDSEDETPSRTKKTINIPCLYLKSRLKTNKTILYFHANGEDLHTGYEFFQLLSNSLMINLVVMEYPGYSLYPGSPSERRILIDAEAVYDHLVNNLKIPEEDIFIFGRSIGSGPATWLASIKNPGLLILMSAFTSVRAVAKHLGGHLAKYLVKERFNNAEFMEDVRCPVFIIHGKKDHLVPVSQARKLYDIAKGPKKIYIAEEMSHCEFDFLADVSVPLTSWLHEFHLLSFESRDFEPMRHREEKINHKIENIEKDQAPNPRQFKSMERSRSSK